MFVGPHFGRLGWVCWSCSTVVAHAQSLPKLKELEPPRVKSVVEVGKETEERMSQNHMRCRADRRMDGQLGPVNVK